jgi:hypothetical protein
MNITHGLRRALQVNAGGVATIFEDRRRTWREIGDRVSRLAAALRVRGLGRGDRIAVLMLNQDRYIECYLTASWAGAAIVPLNTRWSIQENAEALSDCGAKLLVVDSAFAGAGTTLAANAAGGVRLIYADDGVVPDGMLGYEALIAASAPMPDVMAAPDEGWGRSSKRPLPPLFGRLLRAVDVPKHTPKAKDGLESSLPRLEDVAQAISRGGVTQPDSRYRTASVPLAY